MQLQNSYSNKTFTWSLRKKELKAHDQNLNLFLALFTSFEEVSLSHVCETNIEFCSVKASIQYIFLFWTYLTWTYANTRIIKRVQSIFHGFVRMGKNEKNKMFVSFFGFRRSKKWVVWNFWSLFSWLEYSLNENDLILYEFALIFV